MLPPSSQGCHYTPRRRLGHNKSQSLTAAQRIEHYDRREKRRSMFPQAPMLHLPRNRPERASERLCFKGKVSWFFKSTMLSAALRRANCSVSEVPTSFHEKLYQGLLSGGSKYPSRTSPSVWRRNARSTSDSDNNDVLYALLISEEEAEQRLSDPALSSAAAASVAVCV